MRGMNEFLPTTPFDLYELHLLHLVATHRSFTGAAREAGLTQSAITRQVQGVESRLGVALFERTTRHVELTPAGEFLLRETTRAIGDLDAILRRLREGYTNAQKEVRVGVSKSISLAYLPGFFAAQQRRQPHVRLRINHLSSQVLLNRLEANELDVAILSPLKRHSPALRTVHRFDDGFDLIVPADHAIPTVSISRGKKSWQEWFQQQSWLLISEDSNTGNRLRAWLRKRQWLARESTELDDFDLIINLVALGQGISLVPKRSLAIYGRRRNLKRINVPDRFTREIVALARKTPAPAPHVQEFIENILF